MFVYKVLSVRCGAFYSVVARSINQHFQLNVLPTYYIMFNKVILRHNDFFLIHKLLFTPIHSFKLTLNVFLLTDNALAHK